MISIFFKYRNTEFCEVFKTLEIFPFVLVYLFSCTSESQVNILFDSIYISNVLLNINYSILQISMWCKL